MPEQAYRPLTQAEQIFKNLIWTPMIKAGENWLAVEVPFFALPVVKQLDEAVINALTDALFNQICLLIDLAAIHLVNAAHQAAYDKASEELAIIGIEKGTASDEFKQATDKALAEMAKFTHIGPT